MPSPLKFKYYVMDILDGLVTGTNDDVLAREYSDSVAYVVVDVENNKWIQNEIESEIQPVTLIDNIPPEQVGVLEDVEEKIEDVKEVEPPAIQRAPIVDNVNHALTAQIDPRMIKINV